MGKKLRKLTNFISDNFDFEWKTMDRACQVICVLIIVAVVTTVLGISAVAINFSRDEVENVSIDTTEAVEVMTDIYEPIEPVSVDTTKADDPKKPTVSEREIALLALVTMAEAEGEGELGQRLVIDTILNRVDSKQWPNNITDVIYQPGQFSSMWNGRVDRCYVRNDICALVVEELESRTNNDVVYFTAGDYGKYGTPLFREGNHYFSGH